MDTLRAEEPAEGRAYKGLHLDMDVHLGTARPRLEVDIAFGEAVASASEELELPTLLGQPRPRLRAYPRETVVAEKTEALVDLGLLNSRLKDFYDLWFLSQSFTFGGKGTLRCAPLSLTETVEGIAAFLVPALRASASGAPFPRDWPAGGPWQ